jgi:hypothetical protein
MELNAVRVVLAMFQSHDFPLLRNGGDLQLGRDGIIDDQRVITHGFKGRWNTFENSLAVMCDVGCLAVHQALGPVHSAAEDCTQALVTETNAKHGDFAAEVSDGIGGNAIILDRLARSGGDHQVRRVEGDELVHRDLVVTKDSDIRAQLAEVLDQVIGKGVVVIDKHQHV